MNHVHIIAGPTASGKSSYAVKSCQQQDSVIINTDSIQLYDTMPILTAQPSEQEKAAVPHKLFSILHPAESCSAERWRQMASKEIKNAWDSNLLPIFVGGTGFYIKALIEGFSPIPDIPRSVREDTNKLQQSLGNDEFYKLLSAKDSNIVGKINPNDTQRLIRAYEVLEHTDKSIIEWQKLPLSGPPFQDIKFSITILLPNRKVLYEHINSRFDDMIEEGAIEEVRALTEMIENKIVPANAEIIKAHGFRPLRNYLQGSCSLDQAAELTKTQTRQYAKRQTTWLRNQIKPSNFITNIEVLSNYSSK